MKCIAKVANKVKLSEKIKRKAAEIMSNVMKEEISAGKDPMGLAEEWYLRSRNAVPCSIVIADIYCDSSKQLHV